MWRWVAGEVFADAGKNYPKTCGSCGFGVRVLSVWVRRTRSPAEHPWSLSTKVLLIPSQNIQLGPGSANFSE